MDHEGYEDFVSKINKRYREAQEKSTATTTTSNKADARASQKTEYTERTWEPEKKGKKLTRDEQVKEGVMRARASGSMGNPMTITYCAQWANGYACTYGNLCIDRHENPEALPEPPAPPAPPTAPPSATWDWAQAPQTSTIEEWDSAWHANPTTRRQLKDWHSSNYWKES
jgi:hypothetical protein